MERVAFVALGKKYMDEPYIARETRGVAVVRLDVRRIFQKDPQAWQGNRGNALEAKSSQENCKHQPIKHKPVVYSIMIQHESRTHESEPRCGNPTACTRSSSSSAMSFRS